MDFYGFYTGKEMDAYQFLGCHLTGNGAIFRTFAPAAEGIVVIGDFNNWEGTPMHKIHDGNFWECEVDGVKPGMLYKYKIYSKGGNAVDHCDPYGFQMQCPPESASVVTDLYTYKWKDEQWMQQRSDCKDKALNIYEVHMGSWKKKKDDTWYSYQELAKPLVRYVKQKGYNYIEVMPLAEHPCDNSWGYQQTGFYSPTSRYGNPDDLRALIDHAHSEGIGVILDFVPVHFAVDAYGLADYDGTALYEYPNADVGVSEWGSKNFMHSRGEVQSFLQSNANYWLKEFHFDGIRIDALSNIIYWHGNQARGVNKNAVDFIKHMNGALKWIHPSAMLIAEDSTSYEGVTVPTQYGGLGFDYKWDMGWMNDTLAYFRTAPEYRSENYHKLTFSMMYYYSANFLLPLSHDEVVHGKATIIQKMSGDNYENKFAQARALYLYMFTHPGKKLNFMANEIGQFREWDETREQDWDLLKYPAHDAFAKYSMELGKLYLKTPALYEQDYDQNGFQWVDCHQEGKCIYVYERRCASQRVLVVLNLSDREQDYTLHVEGASTLKLLLASDEEKFGGTQKYGRKTKTALDQGELALKLGAFSGRIYEIG